MENKKLTPEQYYHWRYQIEIMQHAETKAKLQRNIYSGIEKDLEIMKLRASAFKNVVKSQEEQAELAKKEYEAFRNKLETELGILLSNCSIDEVSFEIHKLD